MELNKSILDFYHKYSNNIVAEDLGTHWGILFDRNKITINYFYPTENYKIGYYADFVYVTKILNNVSKVTVIGEPLYILNRSGDSVTSSISKTFSFETIDSIHHIEKNITIWDEETNNAFVRKVISLFMVVFSTCNNFKEFKNRYDLLMQDGVKEHFCRAKFDTLKEKIKLNLFKCGGGV